MSYAIDGAHNEAGPAIDADNVSQFLSSPGVGGSGGTWHGATGPITLNADNKFPPDKAVYVLGTDDEGKSTVLLRCGRLPDGEAARKRGDGDHYCPR